MTVILVAHILVAIVLIVVVLMQRSEGGALGIGGGGGAGGGLMSGRGAAGALVNATIIFGAIFFVTSLVLTTISTRSNSGGQTQIEQNLNEEFGTQPGEDDLGIGNIEDILAPDSDLLDDPLGRTETPLRDPAPAETDDTEPADPLGTPQ
ncbi:MAG: preprotein translocase subunit SecG [Henriciella sp.]|nr:preprotein translocase subunit SecG [Henriciella sp.]